MPKASSNGKDTNMPNVFVAHDRIDLAGLGDALLLSRVSAKNREHALLEIQRANPGLNFDRIDPGTVVVVPPVEGLRARSTADPIGVAADDQIQRLIDGIDGLAVAAEQGEENRKAETVRQLAALDAILATGVPNQVPELAQIADSARSTLKQDATAGRVQLDSLHAARDSWLEQLAQLRGLL
jgi:hypothetical protein